jgi:hypothetical protein
MYRSHSTNVFLYHAQMDRETVQFDFEWARNLEQPYGGFNFGESCLTLAKTAPVGALGEFAFKVSESAVQLVDTMDVEPPEKTRRETNDRNQCHDDGDDEEHDSIEERVQPEGRVALPEARARAVKCLRRRRERQIVWLLGGEFTKPIKGAGRPMDFAHGFQQQILQSGVKILSHDQVVARGKQVDVRTWNVASQANEPSP